MIGIVGSVRNSGLHSEPRPQVYRPEAQEGFGAMSLVVRVESGDPAALIKSARDAIHRVDKDLAIAKVRTLEEVVADSVSSRRFNMLLLGLFASLALILSAVGIYGVTSYSVSQRTKEIGLRVALGAQPAGVVRLVMREALTLTGAGVVVGLAAAFALTRLLASLIYGVTTTDPLTFGVVLAVLVGSALLASALPDRKSVV